MSCRVMSLGWCVRTLIRVAWGGSVWPEDDDVSRHLGFVHFSATCGWPPLVLACSWRF